MEIDVMPKMPPKNGNKTLVTIGYIFLAATMISVVASIYTNYKWIQHMKQEKEYWKSQGCKPE